MDRENEIKTIADELMSKLKRAVDELDTVAVTETKKTTTETSSEKTVSETHSITYAKGPVDRSGLKTLTSALRELKEISLNEEDDGNTFIQVSFGDGCEEAAK